MANRKHTTKQRKTNSKKKTVPSKKKITNKKRTTSQPLSHDLKYEIIAILFVGVALLLILSVYFNLGGQLGRHVQYIFFGIFGISAYVVPIFLLVASFYKIFNKGNQRLNDKLSLIFIGIVILSVFAHLHYLEKAQLNQVLSDRSAFFTATAIYYNLSGAKHVAGGFIGGVIGDFLTILISRIGSIIVLCVAGLSLIILITEQSVAQVARAIFKGGKWLGVHLFRLSKEGVEKTGEQIKVYSEKRNTRKEWLEKKHEKQRDLQIKATIEEEKESQSSPLKKTSKSTKKTYKINGMNPFEQIIQQEEKALEKKKQQEGSSKNNESVVAKKEVSVKKGTPVPVSAIQTEIELRENQKKFVLPPIELMQQHISKGKHYSEEGVNESAEKLITTLESFGVGAKILNVSIGPTVTRYELQPDPGVKISKILNLQDDLAMNLAAHGIRIEAPIPGKSAIGIEIPNQNTQAVFLREVIDNKTFKKFPSKIKVALGKDISGKEMIADIGRMPHLLIAGATGSGKSVCVNTLIISMLYTATPEEVRMIMIDPKVVELSTYNGIPHLLIPVVTDPKKAAGALNWAVQEMEDRYKLFAAANVRDLISYNQSVEEHEEGSKLPRIIIIIDELADLMVVAPKEVEGAICRLAQMARAAGLHLIIATQRPSVDVITGLIKANIPSRIAFNVSSGIDSRTIIDSYGAEKLLGKGDMLFYPVGLQKPVRVQGAFISEKEVSHIVTFLKDQAKVVYNEKIMNQLAKDPDEKKGENGNKSDYDAYFNEALELVINKQKASASMIQRYFRVGYNRAARIMEQLFEAGFIGDEEGSKARKVLLTEEDYVTMKENANKKSSSNEDKIKES